MPNSTSAQTNHRHDYAALAKQASLQYVSDEEPGYCRKPHGRGFTYQDANGKTVRDKLLRQRFEDLVIPPMWTQVWICENDNGHLQATGRDEKGRKQYLYHELWNEVRDKAKYDAIIRFGEVLPQLRSKVEQDLNSKDLNRSKILAAVVKLLETTLIRIGNQYYADKNESYGLSTLRSKHVSETEDGLAFDFRGKSAKTHHIELNDERLIKIIKACSDLPGYRIFKYIDADGDKQVVESQDINEYLKASTGEHYSAKDFRTWMATVLAAQFLYENSDSVVLNSPANSKPRQQIVVEMVKYVASQLGNTPSVCRSSYIHPQIITSFLEGDFYDIYKQGRRGRNRQFQQTDEKAVLSLLN